MTEVKLCDVQIWTASPQNFQAAQCSDLSLLLDKTECLLSEQFNVEADRHAYVLAHALRRLALARALAVAPSSIVFSREANGKPVLVGPPERAIFFGHSHTRAAVVCAVTRIGPIGIDAEVSQDRIADFELLESFVALPDAQRREEEVGADPARQFYFYWTALEAFWKATGTGLSSENPRIRCQKNRFGLFEISLEVDGPVKPVARVIPVQSPAGCSITLALSYPTAHQCSFPTIRHVQGEAELNQLFNKHLQQK